MDYQDFSKQQLVEEIKKVNRELQESRELIRAIQSGEVDAIVVHRDKGEQLYVLEDANLIYRRMIEEMNEGAVTFNSDGVVLYSNKAFAGLIQHRIGEVTSSLITSYIDHEFLDVFNNILRVQIEGHINKSIKLIDKSGNRIPVIISLSSLVLEGMEIFLMTVTDQREKLYIKKLSLHQIALEKLTTKLRDAKEEAEQSAKMLKEKNIDYTILNKEYIHINNLLAKTNDELLQAKKKAEKSDRLKSAFIANMSHEIRTPLNSILGYTKILLDSIDDENQKKHINIIKYSGKHLLQLIDDIVDLSRLEAGEMKIVKSKVSLNEMMGVLKNQFLAYALNKGKQHLEFKVLLPSNNLKEPVVYTDEFRVRQVLNNLLSNALKFTDKGTVEFGYEISDRKKEILFFVRDTGSGISKEDQKILFNRFQQGKHPSNIVASGTGLGLAISKGLAGLLGGEIWVESKLGSGSVFYFTVPFEEIITGKPIKPEEKRTINSGIPKLKGKKILLCEDDIYSRQMMLYMLKKTKADLLITTDGRECLEKFRQNNVDLVLLDLRLPEIDGYQVLKEIRSTDPDAFVIAQTAYAMLDDIRKFREVGFTDYLTKPVSDEELFGTLNKYLAPHS
ncbi:MAG: ATP-binding protein [Bacteroidota bacterium]